MSKLLFVRLHLTDRRRGGEREKNYYTANGNGRVDKREKEKERKLPSEPEKNKKIRYKIMYSMEFVFFFLLLFCLKHYSETCFVFVFRYAVDVSK